LVKGNSLQIIIFSIFLGISINLSGEKGKPLLNAIGSLAEVMFKMTGLVMKFAPIGVFGIMAWVSGTMGLEAVYSLGKFVLCYYFTCALYVVVVFFGILWLFHGLHPAPFIRGLWPAMLMAFSTGSSSATLPLLMRCMIDKLGVSRSIANFVLPLGSTINMNGTAIYQGMAAIFVAQSYGMSLDWSTILAIVLTATLTTIGAAGIPGQGFMMMNVVLAAAGIPVEGVFALLAIDRLRDMVGTMLNIMGDAVVAVAVAQEERELDLKAYANPTGPLLEGSEV
jgi:Na+/H+-dicarboxylate symporter